MRRDVQYYTMPVLRALLTVSGLSYQLTGIYWNNVYSDLCSVKLVTMIIALCVWYSCDIHSRDNRGTTPLHWAAAANQPSIIQLLLRSGYSQSMISAFFHQPNTPSPLPPLSPTHIRRGVDRSLKDNDDLTAVEHAEVRGHTECAHILHNYGLHRPSSALSVASQVQCYMTIT